MDALIRSISEWKALDPRVRVAQLRDRDTKRAPERLVVGDRLSPLDLYVYLKARFGPPNGVQMALRNQSSDNLVHWHYTLRADAAVLEIWQANLTTELYLEGTAKPSAEDWSRLIDAIKADYRNYGRAMSQIRKDLERWHLFINPYKRLRDVLERSREDLKSLEVDSVDLPETPVTPQELRNVANAISNEQGRFDEALRLGVLIRMLAPVLGEAFVNFVLFLLAKPDIKADERLYQDVIRREIDIRIKGLHLHCDGFIHPVDAKSERFKRFQTVMNGRNDFLHGNVDPRKLKFDTVYFDYRTVPVFEHRASFGKLALSHRLIQVEPEQALADLDAVLQFIELVLESVEPDVKEILESFMQSTSPGYRADNERVGVLFPEHVIHSVPGDQELPPT